MTLRVLDLFSGIGGFSLGLERTGGFETVAFCEIEPYPRAVLAKHWPGVPCYEDVRELTAARLAADGIAVDVICGGFPCQDISVAGKGAGLAGERSGLWREYARLVGELRPALVIVENVSALLGRGLGTVLGDLSTLGYDAEWHCIPAAAVGAPHRRDRLWIVAHASGDRLRVEPGRRGRSRRTGSPFARYDGATWPLADTSQELLHGSRTAEPDQKSKPANRCEAVAHPDAGDQYGRRGALQMGWGRFASEAIDDGDAGRAQWGAEPDVGRVANGIPSRVDRLGGLGNAVVPQIPELIGYAILEAQKSEVTLPDLEMCE